MLVAVGDLCLVRRDTMQSGRSVSAFQKQEPLKRGHLHQTIWHYIPLASNLENWSLELKWTSDSIRPQMGPAAIRVLSCCVGAVSAGGAHQRSLIPQLKLMLAENYWRALPQAHALFMVNPLKPELNPICYLLALLGAHHLFHVSRIRVKLLTLR